MDTRRMSGSIEIAEAPMADAFVTEVEVIELSAVEKRRRNGLMGRLFFAAAVAVLATLIAIAGIPQRTSFSLNNPLPNLLQQNSAR